jgi:hypothetical protein
MARSGSALTYPHHLHPCAETVRVVLIHKNFVGTGVTHVGLGISAGAIAKTLRQRGPYTRGIWAEVWPAQSAKQIVERLRASNAQADAQGVIRVSHVEIAAPWIETADLAAMAGEFPEVMWTVVCHSNVGFLNADPHAIHLMQELADLQIASHNIFTAGNSRKFTDWATETWGVHMVWLPNLYNLAETFPEQVRKSWDGNSVLKVGLFGAQRPLKNLVTSAAAVATLARWFEVPIELHVSSGRAEGANFNALRELTGRRRDLKVIYTGWLPWPEFRQYLRGMDLGLQVSYTESFNNVAADFIAEGIPVVISDAIDWAPRGWQAKADDPLDVARVAEYLLRSPIAIRDGQRALREYVDNGVIVRRRWLGAELS